MRELTKIMGDYILKRLTELIERLSGFGLRGRSPVPSVMQKAAIELNTVRVATVEFKVALGSASKNIATALAKTM